MNNAKLQNAPPVRLVGCDPIRDGEGAALVAIRESQILGDHAVLVVGLIDAVARGGLFGDGFLDIVARRAVRRE